MLVYLAGPIDHVSDDERTGWRETAQERLMVNDIATFSPVHAFKCVTDAADQQTCEAIIEVNDTAVRNSDVVLANLTGKSFGTPLECQLARHQQIPVIAFGVSPYSIYRHRFVCREDVMDSVAAIIALREGTLGTEVMQTLNG